MDTLFTASRRTLTPVPAAAPTSPPPSLCAGPVIEEIDSASVTSDGSEVDRSFYVADAVQPAWEGEGAGFAAYGAYDATEGVAGDPSREALGDVLLSLLNNPEVSRTIERELRADPAFNALIAAHIVGPELPAPAAALLLEGAENATESAIAGNEGYVVARGARRGRDEPDPLLALLGDIAKGALAAAQHLAVGFVRLGGFLRGIAAEMTEALRAMRLQHADIVSARAGAAGAGDASTTAERVASLERAVVKAACAVAVLVFVRRAVLLPAVL